MESPKSTDLKSIILTILQPITTAAVLGCFGFLWNMNRDMGVMQEHNRLQEISEARWKDNQANELRLVKIEIGEVHGKTNEMQGDVIVLKSAIDEVKKYYVHR